MEFTPIAVKILPESIPCNTKAATKIDNRIHNERLRIGRQAKSVLMVGLRGVGKTVLLDRMMMDAEASGLHTIRLEAPENRSLPALLAPELRRALLRQQGCRHQGRGGARPACAGRFRWQAQADLQRHRNRARFRLSRRNQ